MKLFDAQLGHRYYFDPVNKQPAINDPAQRPQEGFFAEAIRWVMLPRECPRQRGLEIQVWHDGQPVLPGKSMLPFAVPTAVAGEDAWELTPCD